ncbi:ankyrin repeat domain-containing protein, partial [Hyella patelloides]|uniref:ankyrin repeat domain-containing protein n=1 Tax=Hyella patelloides TaxID=1982969 RepID=UPI001643AF49
KKILIENGADVNVKDNKGRNALFYTNNIEIIQLLIENGADVNSRDNFGKTPLTDMVIKASRNLRYIDNINLFIENGADISDLNYENIKKRYKLTSVQDSYLKSFF